MVAFGKPFSLPRIDDRAQREAALPVATARILQEISALLGTSAPAAQNDDT